MTQRLDPTLLPLAAIQAAVDGAVADYHERCFREQCARDAKLREVVQPRVEERDDPRDAEAFFMEEMCPSDASFR